MPQRPTTHKDLHRAAIGLVFSLVYLLAIPGAWAQNRPTAPSAGLSKKSEPGRLVKNEPAKPTPSGPTKEAVRAKDSVPAKAAVTKGGKLREIPLSTLESGKTVSAPAAAQSDTKPDGKSAAKTESASKKETDSSAPKKTEDLAQKTDSASKKKTESAKTKKAVAKTTKTETVSRLNNGLIPPPPPIVPIGMDVLGMYAQPVDYLSMKDLEGRKKELTSRLNELDSTVGDAQRQIKERKERAELFESLYKEGVVSRKELEIAKREAQEIDRDLKFKLDEFESLKVSMKAVNNRLAALKKMEAKMNHGKEKDKKAVAAGKLKSTQKKR